MNAMIIIDMQEASFSKSDQYDVEGVINRINRLSEHIREKGGRIIFIQHDGNEAEGLQPFTPGWEILSSLVKYDADIVVRKTTNDSFYNTALNRRLRDINAKTLVFAGWATDFCVDTTVRSALSHNYDVVVAADCHTVSDRPHLRARQVIEHHNWIWKNLLTAGADVNVLPHGSLCDYKQGDRCPAE